MYGMTSKILTHEYIYIYIYIKNSLVTQLLNYIYMTCCNRCYYIMQKKKKIMLKKTKTGSNQYIFFLKYWVTQLLICTNHSATWISTKRKKSMEEIKLRHNAMKWKINNMQCIQIKGKAIFISHENFNILYTNKTKN